MRETDRKDIGSCRSRRDFAKKVALLAVAPLLSSPGSIRSQEKESAKDKPGEIVAGALTQIVQARYGQYLTPEQMKEVKKSIEGKQRTAETMKKVKLQNSDEPAFSFFADLP
jgi:hypothetical protein